MSRDIRCSSCGGWVAERETVLRMIQTGFSGSRYGGPFYNDRAVCVACANAIDRSSRQSHAAQGISAVITTLLFGYWASEAGFGLSMFFWALVVYIALHRLIHSVWQGVASSYAPSPSQRRLRISALLAGLAFPLAYFGLKTGESTLVDFGNAGFASFLVFLAAFPFAAIVVAVTRPTQGTQANSDSGELPHLGKSPEAGVNGRRRAPPELPRP